MTVILTICPPRARAHTHVARSIERRIYIQVAHEGRRFGTAIGGRWKSSSTTVPVPALLIHIVFYFSLSSSSFASSFFFFFRNRRHAYARLDIAFFARFCYRSTFATRASLLLATSRSVCCLAYLQRYLFKILIIFFYAGYHEIGKRNRRSEVGHDDIAENVKTISANNREQVFIEADVKKDKVFRSVSSHRASNKIRFSCSLASRIRHSSR